MSVYIEDLPDKNHFSLAELSHLVEKVDGCSNVAARNRIYRKKWTNELPVFRAMGQDRVKRDDLIRFLGLENKNKPQHPKEGHIYVG
jgi:hypothetical protein